MIITHTVYITSTQAMHDLDAVLQVAPMNNIYMTMFPPRWQHNHFLTPLLGITVTAGSIVTALTHTFTCPTQSQLWHCHCWPWLTEKKTWVQTTTHHQHLVTSKRVVDTTPSPSYHQGWLRRFWILNLWRWLTQHWKIHSITAQANHLSPRNSQYVTYPSEWKTSHQDTQRRPQNVLIIKQPSFGLRRLWWSMQGLLWQICNYPFCHLSCKSFVM